MSLAPGIDTVGTGMNTPASGFAPQWGDLLSLIFSGQPLGGGGPTSAIPKPARGGGSGLTTGEWDAIWGPGSQYANVPVGATSAPGRSPTAQTQAIAQNIANLMKQRDVSTAQSSIQQLIEKDVTSGLANLREGFTARGGGTATGTPAAVAASRFMAEAVPRKALATEQIQQQELARVAAFLLPLLGLGQQFAGIGIPQAEESVVVSDSTFQQWMDALAGLSQGAGSIATGVAGGGR